MPDPALSSVCNHTTTQINPDPQLPARCRGSPRQRLGFLNSCLLLSLHSTPDNRSEQPFCVMSCKLQLCLRLGFSSGVPGLYTGVKRQKTLLSAISISSHKILLLSWCLHLQQTEQRIAKKPIFKLFTKACFQLIIILKNHPAAVCESWV